MPAPNSKRNSSGIRGIFRSLRFRDYRLLFFGQVISISGTAMQTMALSWLVFSLSGSALNLGFNVFLSTVPTLLLSYQGGRLADRFSAKRVLMVTQNAAIGLTLALFAVALGGGLTVPLLYGFTLLQGILDALEVPSRQVLVRQTIPDKTYLVNALSLTTSLLHISRIAGPALAAIVLSLWGAPICFLLNAVSYLFSIFTIRQIHTPKKLPPAVSKVGLLTIIKHIWSKPFIRAMVQLYVVMGLLGIQYLVILPAFVSIHLHLAESALGTIMACSALGSLLASLVLAALADVPRLAKGIGPSVIGFGLSLMAFASAPNLAVAMLLSLPLGLFQTFSMSGSSALVQQLIKNEAVRGRVLSLFTFLSIGAAAPGALLIGLLATSLGPVPALTICGLICTVIGINFAQSTRKLDARTVDL